MDIIMMHRSDFEDAIRDAAQRAADLAVRKMPKDRPTQYNLKDAANEIGVHPNTITNMVKAGTIKLNAFGKVPVEQIDKLLKCG